MARKRRTGLKVFLSILTVVVLVVAFFVGRAIISIQTPDTALTEEQKAEPYANYFDQDMVAPSAELQAAVSAPIDCDDALPINEINTLLEPGYQEVETGYCVFDDGGGYASALIDMPGVTLEMIDWWFIWHPQESLRYKIWDKEDHFDVTISDADRAKFNDESLTYAERLWGSTHHVRENIGVPVAFRLLEGLTGADPYAIDITFISPEDCGFDMTKFDTSTETVICAESGMRHFVRKTADGVELRSRFYAGYVEQDGEFVRDSDSETPIDIEAALNQHMIEEFTNLASFLPELYAEYGPSAGTTD